MPNTNPSEPMKILIRRLGGGDAIIRADDGTKVSHGRSDYRYVACRYAANTNVVEASIARGYIEQDKTGQYILSALGKSIYEKRNGNFVNWQIKITTNFDKITQEHGNDVDLSEHLRWKCDAVPMGKNGPVSWQSLNVRANSFRWGYRTLDDLISDITVVLMHRAGFSKHQIAISELTPEMIDLDERQQMFFVSHKDIKSAAYAEAKERKKREEQMDESHFLMTPISTLSLSVRASNCLRDANISVLGELINMHDGDIRALKGVARRTLNDIKEALAERDMFLGMVELQEWQLEEIERLKTEKLLVEGQYQGAT